MMRIKGQFKEITTNADGSCNIVFRGTRSDCKELEKNIQEFSKRKDVRDIDLSINISKYKSARTLSANSYFWELCDKVADKMTQGNKLYLKSDIYKGYIKDVGLFRDVTIESKAVETLSYSWSLQGLGWFSEKVEESERGNYAVLRLYYGSSCYNSKQMKRLIDCVIEDCKALDIETRTPFEIAEMVALLDKG